MNEQKEQQKLTPETSRTLRFFAGLNKLFRSKTGLWCSLLVLIVLAGLLVARSARQGEDPRFDLPEELSILIDDAVEVCSDDDPWEAGCVETVWAACEWSRRFWTNVLDHELEPGEEYQDKPLILARSYPFEFLCRAAHMAELARIASVLVDRYGDEFYEEEVRIDWFGDPVFGDFWRFREHITYTPWRPDVAYSISIWVEHGFDRNAGRVIGPVLSDHSSYYTVGRWLEKIQNWGPLRFRPVDVLSDNAVDVLSSILGKIVSLAKPYDSWPYDATSDPRTGDVRRIQPLNWSYFPEMYRIYRGSAYIDDSDVFSRCYIAIGALRIGKQGWEKSIDDCYVDAKSCSLDPDEFFDICAELAELAELEREWKQLFEICSPKDRDPFDRCLISAKEICATGGKISRAVGLHFLRYKEIRWASCFINNVPISEHLPHAKPTPR